MGHSRYTVWGRPLERVPGILAGCLALCAAGGGLAGEGNRPSSGTPLRDLNYTGPWRSYYPSGKLMALAHFVKGRGHGRYTEWHENAKKRLEGTMVEDRPEARCLIWWPNGRLRAETFYVKGRLHGKSTYWRRDGTREIVLPMASGKIHGLVTEWHPNGAKAAACVHRLGMKVKTRKEGAPNGRLIEIRHYQNGKISGKTVSLFPSGKVRAVGIYKDGKPEDGSCLLKANGRLRVFYYLSGKPITKAEYEKALAAGKVPALKAGKELAGLDLKPNPAPVVKGGKGKTAAAEAAASRSGRGTPP